MAKLKVKTQNLIAGLRHHATRGSTPEHRAKTAKMYRSMLASDRAGFGKKTHRLKTFMKRYGKEHGMPKTGPYAAGKMG